MHTTRYRRPQDPALSRGMAGAWPAGVSAGTVGVEEEFLLVDAETGDAVAAIEPVIAHSAGRATREFVQELVETCTPVCDGPGDLLRELVAMRTSLAADAAAAGSAIVGVGTHPFARPEDLTLTDTDRYHAMRELLPWTWREATTCGMHVHVAVPTADAAITVCDRLRLVMPVLLAMSANSPLWRGQRTGLQSVRTVLRRMQPRTGLPPLLRSWDAFADRLETLADAGIPDGSWIWWGVRPHVTYGTVEVRVFDTQSDVRNAHALACLTRALVAHLQEHPALFAVDDDSLLEESWWNAMSDGVDGLHILGGHPTRTRPLRDSALELVDVLRDRLDGGVAARLRRLAEMPEAHLQVRDFEAGGAAGAVRSATRRTMAGVGAAPVAAVVAGGEAAGSPFTFGRIL